MNKQEFQKRVKYNYENGLPTMNLPKIDRTRKSENDFMKDLIESSNIVNNYLVSISKLRPTKDVENSYHGVILGHMVRLYKLYDSFLLLTVSKGYETASIISRSILETVINLIYLLKYDSKENIEEYKKSSLWYEKKLWDEIMKRKRDPPLPIEKRMLASIKNTFDRAGVEMNSICRDDRSWGDLYSKADKTGLIDIYEFNFRGASYSVHGTWHDLEVNHIKKENDGHFEPLIDYTTSRPQPVEAMAILCLMASTKYVKKIMDKDFCNQICKDLTSLENFFYELMELHESFLQ